MGTTFRATKSINFKILLEITVVMVSMQSLKALTDYFNITKSGSIAMWYGIIITTYFLRKS